MTFFIFFILLFSPLCNIHRQIKNILHLHNKRLCFPVYFHITNFLSMPNSSLLSMVYYLLSDRTSRVFIYIYIIIRHDRLGCAGLSNITQLILARSNISSQYLAKVHSL